MTHLKVILETRTMKALKLPTLNTLLWTTFNCDFVSDTWGSPASLLLPSPQLSSLLYLRAGSALPLLAVVTSICRCSPHCFLGTHPLTDRCRLDLASATVLGMAASCEEEELRAAALIGAGTETFFWDPNALRTKCSWDSGFLQSTKLRSKS